MGLHTLTYSESAQGWPSFYSFMPDWMIGMNKFFYSFKAGNLWKHNVNETRNNFYGVQYTSKIRSVFNEVPTENKLFKTMSLQGDDSWKADLQTDIEATGYIEKDWFQKKEQVYFAFIRNSGDIPASPESYVLRLMNGIGKSDKIFFSIGGLRAPVPSPQTWAEIRFSIYPLVDIGDIISVGDYMYFSNPPYETILLAGQVVEVNRDYPNGKNYIRIKSSIPNAQPVNLDHPFWMYIKNSVAESHGVLGHYCVFDLENDNTEKVELFMAETEAMKSFP